MGTNAFGQPLRRKEDTTLLTGRGRFTQDMITPDMTRAVVVRSPHAHARIRAIDTRAAAELPGVLAILTGADYASDGLGSIPPGSDLVKFPGTPDSAGFRFRPEHPALARDVVRFVGDSVAFIVAETIEQAQDAAETSASTTTFSRPLRVPPRRG